MFIVLRSAIHLMGDGYLLIRELGMSLWQVSPRNDHAPCSFWAVSTLHELGKHLWDSAENTYRVYSYASGFLYLALSFGFAGIVRRDHLHRAVTLSFLLTPGFIQLFFGYVENYSFIYPIFLLYLLIGFLALRRALPVWVAAAVLGILIPLHFTLV